MIVNHDIFSGIEVSGYSDLTRSDFFVVSSPCPLFRKGALLKEEMRIYWKMLTLSFVLDFVYFYGADNLSSSCMGKRCKWGRLLNSRRKDIPA